MTLHGSRYELFGEIGRNNYAVVYDGHDLNIKRDVAILALHDRFRNDSHRWSAIWNQVLQLCDAKIDNVVPVHDAIQEKGWIVCERMRGNLQEKLRTEPLPEEMVRSVLRQALEALRSYHALKICHGDVKPANLLYNNDGHIRLSFSPGLILGGQIPRREKDFRYLIPETLNPGLGEIGPASDLYCLGFSALELLTGPKFSSFFRGAGENAIDEDAAWLKWHTSPNETITRIEEMAPGISEDLINVIGRMIRKPVSERYQSAEEALHDLKEQAIVSIAVPAPGKGSSKPAVSQSPASPAPAAKAVSAPPPSRPRPVKKSAGPRPLSETLNEKLNDKRVLSVVIAAMLLPLLWFLFFVDTSDRIPVEIVTTPEGATIEINGKEQAGVTPFTLKLPPGDHALVLALTGHQPQKATKALAANETSAKWEFDFIPTKKSPENMTQSTESTKSSAAGTRPVEKTPKKPLAAKLPPGLIAAEGAKIHPQLHLPERVVVEKLKSSSIPLELVLIEAGAFKFGKETPSTYGDLPARDETVPDPYYFAVYETTNDQFQAFADEANNAGGRRWKEFAERIRTDAGTCPVVGVSRDQASSFCEWVSPSGRLPTEVEWEYAARSEKGNPFPWNEGELTAERANVDFNDGRLPSELGLVPVTRLEAGKSALGLQHLLGNAAEMCHALFKDGYKVREDFDLAVNKGIVSRGGSYLSDAKSVATTFREAFPEEGDQFVGFRVLVELHSTDRKTGASREEGSGSEAAPPQQTGGKADEKEQTSPR